MNPISDVPLKCDTAELRTLFLFEKLTDAQLETLCDLGHVELIDPGWAYREGEAATCFYVMLDGSVVLYRRVTRRLPSAASHITQHTDRHHHSEGFPRFVPAPRPSSRHLHNR